MPTLELDQLLDREQVAERLLDASEKHSFDPDVEVDWDAPLEDGKWCIPEQLVSLHGTPMWERMPLEQRLDLSRHEAASTASIGIWFEIILMQLLTRHMYDLDYLSDHVRYGLTELADECRHSKMFARMIHTLGCPLYRPDALIRFLGRFIKTYATTPGAFTATLLCEEILDRMQRQIFPDESVQPMVRDVTRIHVVEESRHIRYAREELDRQMRVSGRTERQWTRFTSGIAAVLVAETIISPEVYANVGLDREEALRQVRASEQRGETLRWSAEKLTGFLRGNGVIAGPTATALWRRARLL
jgi:hypothetical protein